MKRLLIISSILFGSFHIFASGQSSARDSTKTCGLTIHMTGFRNNIGNGGATIFTSPDGWPENNDKAFKHDGVQVQNKEATLKFEVPPGTYAIAALHDENKNHKLDRNFLGIPKEGFGFANNPHVGLKAPPFSAAAVKVTGDMTVEIKMQYK